MAPMRIFKTTNWWNWDCDICSKHGVASYWRTAFTVGFAHMLFSHKEWRKPV